MDTAEQKRLLIMLKVLADESRLTILTLLHEREHAAGELAQRIELTEPTVSHHLTRMREAGLITLRMAGNQRFYTVNERKLADFKRLVGEIEQTPIVEETPAADNSWIDALDWSAEDKTVLREHTANGQIERLPAKQKKVIVILRWLAMLFEPDRMYTEPEVNAILKERYAHDHVSLRRDLVDFGYLRRERGGGKYWLAPADEGESPVNIQE